MVAFILITLYTQNQENDEIPWTQAEEGGCRNHKPHMLY